MKKLPVTSSPNRIRSHFNSIATYLKQHAENTDFRVCDWLRTVDLEDLGRMRKAGNSIYVSFLSGSPMTRQAKDFAKAVCLASAAEKPDVDAELITRHLDIFLRAMLDAVYIEVMARCEWVIVTQRVSVWPCAEKPYQVTRRGRAEGEQLQSPRSRAMLGLAPPPMPS
jgi:hypothetical protein